MKYFLEKLKEFNKAFRVPVDGDILNPSRLRYELMKEENKEYLGASLSDSVYETKKEIIDAIGDKLYILCGTIVHHGLQDYIKDIFDEVHRSNMSKLDDDGNPIINGEELDLFDETKPLGKVLKSDNFTEPNFDDIIKRIDR